jgi:hypothetical protein
MERLDDRPRRQLILRPIGGTGGPATMDLSLLGDDSRVPFLISDWWKTREKFLATRWMGDSLREEPLRFDDPPTLKSLPLLRLLAVAVGREHSPLSSRGCGRSPQRLLGGS